ncbi:MAG: hypothetical protein ACJAR3_000883 [Roseivirga sp.]
MIAYEHLENHYLDFEFGHCISGIRTLFLTGIQFVNMKRVSKNKVTRDLSGLTSRSEKVRLSTAYYDLEYLFLYKDGEVIIGENFMIPKNLTISSDFNEATAIGFIEVEVQGNQYNLPVNESKVYLLMRGDKTPVYIYLSLAITLMYSTLKLIMLVWARRLVLNFNNGAFFIPQNHQIIARMGFLFSITALADFLGWQDFLNTNTVAVSLPNGYLLNTISASFNWNYIYLGLLLLATATAFKQNLKLQEDQYLTI